jgi:predicted AlkP superfamily phosphohydrolase/phosphomutase
MSQALKPKAMLVGIDAADPTYIDRRIAEGALPNIARVRNEGVWGPMRSTFPVLSSAAWTTIVTGQPPERHGIFEFFRRKPGTWIDELVLGGMKKVPNVWDIAAQHGLRSVVVNVPMTYPPKAPEGGVLVAGMDTPGEQSAFVDPPEEKPHLLKEVPDYRIELTAAQFNTVEDFLDKVESTMDARLKAALHLFERHTPDLAVVIFTALDRVLHALWKYVDPNHDAYHRPEAEAWRARVDRLYDRVDAHLGTLLDWTGEDTTTVVCSDHGGAAVHGVFYLNRWLAREGYLSVQQGKGGEMLGLLTGLQHFAKRVVPRPVKNVVNKIFPGLYADVGSTHGLQRLDPGRTMAYAWRKASVIRVNLKGREPGGIVEPGGSYDALLNEIAHKLENVVDSRNGRKPIRKVWLRREAYPLSEPLDDCPDLVIEWDDRLYQVDTTLDGLANGLLFAGEEKPDKPWREEINGDHALYGVFGAVGKGVAQGLDLAGADIHAVTPTLLAALGIPKPEDMPADPPKGLFTDEATFQTSSVSKTDSPAVKTSESSEAGDVYTDEEREILEKRMRDLGYM